MKVLDVNIPGSEYKIYIGKGLLKELGNKIKKIYSGRKIVIITDDNVFELYGNSVKENLENNGYKVEFISVKPGEESKSLSTLQNVYDKLVEYKVNRGELIIALGGGVVGDLAGFAASTFKRGVNYVQIPTTLLSQVDSSVGGKVAVNLPQGKNLVGSFYHPKAVYIDTTVLETLESKYKSDGIAEIIKYALIKDRELFEKLEVYKTIDEVINNVEEIIYTALDIKRNVVEKDEKDKGERAILNFGHTLGHAVEKYYNYERYTHGAGVAIGMYYMAQKLGNDDITTRLKNMLQKYNLPYELPVDRSELIDTIKLDKKADKDKLNIVLLEDIGKVKIHKIDIDDVNEKF